MPPDYRHGGIINIFLDRSYMYRSGPLPLTFEGPEQGFEDKNCQNASPGKP